MKFNDSEKTEIKFKYIHGIVADGTDILVLRGPQTQRLLYEHLHEYQHDIKYLLGQYAIYGFLFDTFDIRAFNLDLLTGYEKHGPLEIMLLYDNDQYYIPYEDTEERDKDYSCFVSRVENPLPPAA